MVQPLRELSANLNYAADHENQRDGVAKLYKLLIPLYRDRLQTVVSNVVARFLAKPTTSCQGGQLEGELSKDAGLASRLASVPIDTCCGQSLAELTQELDDSYCARNVHVNSDVVLRAELKELHDAGVHNLMAEVMPAASHIVRHYDEFLALLD